MSDDTNEFIKARVEYFCSLKFGVKPGFEFIIGPRKPRTIFVFGSNLAGRHGKGAALEARQKHGAVYGQGEGLQGDSYAIPTKDARLNSLPLESIASYVAKFIDFARQHPDLRFFVTEIGCGLAGYTREQIAPMFVAAPRNCMLSKDFDLIIEGKSRV